MNDLKSFNVSFRTWLMLLSAISSLPMILFSIASLAVLVDNQQYDEKIRLDQAAMALSLNIERFISSRAAILIAIANGNAAQTNNIEALYNHSARLIASNPEFYSIALIDPDGKIIFNTLQPYGTRLPDTRDPASAAQVIAAKRPQVSGAFYGTVSHKMVTALGVPIFVAKQARYCLRAIMPVADIEAILRQQYFPQTWSAAVMAGNTPVAVYGPLYSDAADPKDTGGTAPQGSTGEKRDERIETALIDVGQWGWRVTVSLPRIAFVRPLRRLLFKFGAVGFACALIGVIASQLLSRRLGRDISELASASAALSTGRPTFEEGTIIREMGAVRAGLLAAKNREEQAMTDQLTGLPGRARFWELARALEEGLRNDAGRGLAVMYLDLDGFKQVNDVYGHDQGDAILRGVAVILRESVRDTDVVCRLGGDEFAICLSAGKDHLASAATALAERIVGKVDTLGYGIGCSIGIALSRPDASDLARSLTLADKAMYEAKRLGKNRAVVWKDTGA